MIKPILPALLLLSACNPASSGGATTNAAAVADPAPAAAPKAAAKAYRDAGKDALMSWSLTYPAEVAAIPTLADSIRAKFERAKRENRAAAEDQKEAMVQQGYDFNGYEQSNSYEVAGSTGALLSVEDDWYAFTGGAHPNHGTGAILWDRGANREVTIGDLVEGGASSFEHLYRAPYCKALDSERKARREGADMGTDPNDPFNACPKFEELSIIARSAQKGGPLTRFTFHADPYVAGPYVEGDFDIELPVTGEFLSALKPAYRASFATP